VVQPGKGKRKQHGLHPLALGLLSGWVSQIRGVKTDAGVKRRLRRIDEARALSVSVPSTLQAQLRAYQEDGVAWLQRLSHYGAGACLADDMGLGKTLQTLALLLSRVARGPALVVAPTSVCQNWMDEALRFAPSLRMQRVGGSDSEATIDGAAAGDVLVISYSAMVQRSEALAGKRFATLVLDEAQAIKNSATQRARAASTLLGDFRIATTGTPVENHLGELWSIMSFLNPGLLGTPREFTERYARPIQRDGDRAALSSLRQLIAPFVLRRLKGEVLQELPALTEIVHHVEPDGDERAFYLALRQKALERIRGLDTSLGDKMQQGHMYLLAELTRLRRAACHPSLVGGDGVPSAKVAAVLELIDGLRAGNHRALLFSQFVDFLSIVKQALEQRGVSYRYLDGSTPERQRSAAVRECQAGAGDVFLISLKAGGFGLNLTAADYVIHLDPWWNPAVERQASDRAHRIGQTRPVTVYRLVLRGSIEEQVLSLHADKRELAEKLLSGNDRMTALDLATLRALLEGPSTDEPRTPATTKRGGRTNGTRARQVIAPG
jgi:SNF2 family DNA or RNA helicase